jgi:hypothetical protein
MKTAIIKVKQQTKELLNECVIELKVCYPELIKQNITQDYILERVCLYYLDRTKKPPKGIMRNNE